MDQENTKKIKIARKFRSDPSADLQKYFQKCFGASRYIYNEAIKYINTTYKEKLEEITERKIFGCIHVDETDKQCQGDLLNTYFCKEHFNEIINWGIPYNFFDLRKLILRSNDKLKPNEEWQQEIIYDVRQLIGASSPR